MDTMTLSSLQTAKAIEYLLALGFLALFVPFWKYSARLVTKPAAARSTQTVVAPAVIPSRREPVGWFHVPDGVGLHPGHAWAKAIDDGEVIVGIDDFARAAIGRIDDIDLPSPGTFVRQGEPAWTLRGAAGPLPMVSPVDGLVVAANPAARVGATESDPYGGGWLLRVEAPRFKTNARQLLTASAARAWMEDVAKRLRRSMAPELGPAMADGGVPVAGLAGEVGPEAWRRIAREFFFVESD